MSEKCKSCASCGMPLENKEDFALGDPSQIYCRYCTDPTGKLLPFQTILAMNAKQFEESQGITEEASIRMARDILRNQPAWKGLGV
ncbi:zinc ribbon domain protein [Leptospira broomii serovar Hurstbridge str. 5399]|uniref:Zinc ribbon domain protein n=1 Tax=Leptospira broomii serovar Hurstbridge str. 5399 TaxID=1049789 RepID=T0F5W4_9LEPT|nr:zinc ribbon domain-containing protein [Leptospira broomii]EQA43316.1 zinc ribbon domain protein [Leptospira broomii serovar Hurstbridge str. 5399]